MFTRFLTIFLVSTTFVCAQVQYDTLSSMQVGMGAYYYKMEAPSVPWSFNVLKVDISNEYNSVETVKADNLLHGFETTSSMAERNNSEGHRVIGGVNGDFYGGGGVPINTQVINGEVLKNPISNSIIGFDLKQIPFIEIVNLSGIVLADGMETSIHGVNKERGTDQMIVYNNFFGNSTNTNQWGTEISLQNLEPWLVNDTVACVVQSGDTDGDMSIGDNRVVLSGHGSSNDFINENIELGDTIKVVVSLTPGLDKTKELIGGYPQIVKDGSNYAQEGVNEEGGPGHASDRHPRTSVGFSADSTELYLVTVDGRQPHSAGMTLTELADFMVYIGVHNGINLDGGGSTTMVLGDSVVNKPSDGNETERPVANSLLVISSAPSGELNEARVSPNFIKVFRGNSVNFSVHGLDEYFNPVNINMNEVDFSLSHDLGEIDQSGKFTAGMEADTGQLYVDYEGAKDTARIIVKTITDIKLSPANVVTDTFRTLSYRMRAFDLDGIPRELALNEVDWKLTDNTVGEIDTAGNFKGKSSGKTRVIASYENSVKDTADVTVEINEGDALLDSLESFENWTFSGENMNGDSTSINISNEEFIQGKGSFELQYNFTYDPAELNYIHMNNSIPIEGIPDSMFINVKTDGEKHHVRYLVSDDNGEKFRIVTKKWAEEAEFFDRLPAAFSDATEVGHGSFFNFPVTLEKISIKLAGGGEEGETYSGTIYLDNLVVKYPFTVTSINEGENIPDKFKVYQNYPNPFNPATNIKFELVESGNVELSVYDVLGRKIDVLVNEDMNPGSYNVKWHAKNLSSGVYFYRLNFEGKIITKKMLLLR